LLLEESIRKPPGVHPMRSSQAIVRQRVTRAHWSPNRGAICVLGIKYGSLAFILIEAFFLVDDPAMEMEGTTTGSSQPPIRNPNRPLNYDNFLFIEGDGIVKKRNSVH
jgi:hypothetical protein